MKNLHLYSTASTLTTGIALPDTLGFCVDAANAWTYFALPKSIVVVDRELAEIRRIPWDTTGLGQLVLFDFLADDLDICAVFSEGVILHVSMQTDLVQELPVLFEHRVLGGAWSPDMSLLVIATDSKLLGVSRAFEVEFETDLITTTPGKEELQTIGWGARETQFQGLAGRQKREKVDPDTIPGPVAAYDEGRVVVTWRNDAQFFAVSTIERRPNPADQEPVDARHVRVWNRDFELMSHCQDVAGAEPVLAMRPTGNLIATSRVRDGTRDVWFYERNGQVRSKFAAGNVHEGDAVVQLAWNSDSSILLIHTRQLKRHLLQLWTVSNYDWALKLELDTDSLIAARWDPECPRRLAFLTSAGRFDVVEVDHGYDCVNSLVVSVAGGGIRVTDLQKAPIPPPMYHTLLESGRTGLLLLAQSANGLALLLSDQRLVTYRLVGRRYEPFAAVRLARNSALLPHSLQWTDTDSVSLLTGNTLTAYSIDSGDELVSISLEKEVVYHEPNPVLASSWLVHTADGAWIDVAATGEIAARSRINFPAPCSTAKVVAHRGKLIFFGINAHRQLIINGHVAHQAVGSWHFGIDDFAVTTLGNLLLAMAYEDLAGLLAAPPRMTAANVAHGWFSEATARNLERGGLLVAYEPTGVRMCIQMPRGNLEVIEPRFRLLPTLKRMLGAKQYHAAIVLMRRQRVDMNLIVDYDPTTFLAEAKSFVDQLDDADLLNLFVSSLEGSDVTKKSFAAYFKDAESRPSLANKIQKVTAAVRDVVLAISDTKRRHRLYTVALSCFIKQSPPAIAAAFVDMKKQVAGTGQPLAQTNEQFVSQKPSLFRLWTKHLKYFVKPRDLFHGVLQTYDLTLAYEVADEIGMDPREFMPLLRTLQEYEPLDYQRYQIDIVVEDPISALRHIATVEDRIDECLSHVKTHKLYANALSLFRDSPNYAKVCKLAGDHAHAQKRFEEAAVLLVKAGDFKSAMQCLEAADNLTAVVAVARKAGVDPSQLIKGWAIKHETQGHFVTAAEAWQLLGEREHQRSIALDFAKGQDWRRAQLVLLNADSTADLEAVVTPEAAARAETLIFELPRTLETIKRQTARIEAIRSEKDRQVVAWINDEGDAEVDLAQSETASQASTLSTVSNISRLSKMSVAQARKRKTVERKKRVVKEGSQFEDIAILASLTETFGGLTRIQIELLHLLPLLVYLDLTDAAGVLQKIAVAVVKEAADLRMTIWPRYLLPKHITGPLSEVYRCEDGIIRMPGDNQMPNRIYLEDEMLPPKFDTSLSWRLSALE